MRQTRDFSSVYLMPSLLLMLGLFGPFLASHDAGAIDLDASYSLPSHSHWLGASENGVDIFSELLFGSRTALIVGLSVVFLALTFGSLLGILSVSSRRLRPFLVVLADAFQAFPALVLNVAIIAIVDSPKLHHIVLALAMTSWPLFFRLARAEFTSITSEGYFVAATALGSRNGYSLRHHVLPNIASPLLVQATAAMGGVILRESTLSFLGLGAENSSSWGNLIQQGAAVLFVHPHIVVIVGIVLATFVVSFNLWGDSIVKH